MYNAVETNRLLGTLRTASSHRTAHIIGAFGEFSFLGLLPYLGRPALVRSFARSLRNWIRFVTACVYTARPGTQRRVDSIGFNARSLLI